MTTTPMVDEKKLMDFMGRLVTDLSAAMSLGTGLLGDRLGLYKALHGAGPMTSAQLAAKTGTTERYVREWLVNQAAAGYLTYDARAQTYELPHEHGLALAEEGSPVFVGGAFMLINAVLKSDERIANAFRTGEGMAWGEHHHDLFPGTERFFRTSYAAHLVAEWLPALTGVVAKLERGATVADVGCGHGASTILMAKAFPQSRFHGYDFHAPSIEAARRAARDAGVADRCAFEVADSASFPNQGDGYDLVCFFDCLHDMGRPVDAIRRSRETLKPDGTVLAVEPMGGRTVAENFNPVGRLYSAASCMVCSPNAVATGGQVLGTVASDDALGEVFQAGGLPRWRRATETPFNRIFEARI